MDYKHITATITSLEKKYNLFSLRQNGIYIWKLTRMPAMQYIITKSNNIESIHGVAQSKKKWLRVIEFLKLSLMNNPFLISRNKSKVILENPRKVKQNNQMIDPYTHYFLKDLNDFQVVADLYKLKYASSVYKPSSSTHMLLLGQKLFKLLTKRSKLSTANLTKIKKVEQELNESLNINIPLVNMALNQYNSFLSSYYIYNLLFKKRWKELYLVCSYGKESLISAAHNNNIKVIEFQHGVMGPYHLGYHFPGIDTVPYFPDEVKLFGEFWDKTTALPKKTKKSYYGYPYLKEYIKEKKDKIENKDDKQIIVISQGTIGKQLSEFIYKLAPTLPGYIFKYKLHPGEFGRWKKEYPMLVELNKLPNVQVYENEENLYDLFSSSKYVLGVASTAIFEAIAFKVEPIIIKISSYEYMNDLHQQYNVPILESSSDVRSYIVNYDVNRDHLNVNIESLFHGLYSY